MKTSRELIDEQYCLWGQIQEIGRAIRALQSIDAGLRQKADAVELELEKRIESMRDCLRGKNNGEVT